jgi:hypothetical protein
MRRFVSWLVLLPVFGSFTAVSAYLVGLRAAAGSHLPAYSVYSQAADGLGQTATWLRRLGWEPVPLTRPVQHADLRQARGCLLVVAEPESTQAGVAGDTTDLSDGDVRGLLDWVGQGNTLLFCSRTMTSLHRALNLVLTNAVAVGPEYETDVDLAEAGGYTDEIDSLIVEGQDVLTGGPALPLWWVGGEAGAVLVRRGQGRVLVVADPSLLTPRGLHRADTVRFLYNVVHRHAGDGRVYFDEYHHGVRAGGGFWGYLRLHDQQASVLLVLVAAGMAAWSVAVRLGRPVLSPTFTPLAGAGERTLGADAVDYASAVARIYRRAGLASLLGKTFARDFLDSLRRQLHLGRTALPAEILAAWRLRYGPAGAERLEPLLRGLAALRRPALTNRQLLTWTRALDQFQSEVARAR